MHSQKAISLAVVFLLITFNFNISNAQNIRFGIKGGLNRSIVSGKTSSEKKEKTGFNSYLFADLINLKVFTLSMETGYTQKGFEVPIDVYSEKFILISREKAIAKLGYVDISVLGKLKIPGSIIIPYILAGPSLGIKVDDCVSSPVEKNYYNYYDLQSFLRHFENATFGMKIGIGTELNFIKNVSLLIEARYNADFTDSYNGPDFRFGIETWTYSDDIKNQVFEFLVGVKF